MPHLSRRSRKWAPPESHLSSLAGQMGAARTKPRTWSSIIIKLGELLNTAANQLRVTCRRHHHHHHHHHHHYHLLHLIPLKLALLLLALSQPLVASARLASALGFVDEFAVNLSADLDLPREDPRLEFQLGQSVRAEQVTDRGDYSTASRAPAQLSDSPNASTRTSSSTTQLISAATNSHLDDEALRMYQNGFTMNQTFGDNRTTNQQQQQQQPLINGSDADNDEETTMFTWMIVCTNFFILAVGLCGNSIVILVIWNNHRETTVNHIYIKNLAYADLMFTIGLFFLNTTMITHRWIFGNLMCKIYMATTSLSQFGSSFLLVAMAFDRFIAVCHPIFAQRFRQNDKASAICFVIWFWCSILTIPILMFAKNNKGDTCAIYWPEYSTFNSELTFILYSCFFGFGLPECFIGVFYSCVIKTLRRSAMMQVNLNSTRRSQNRDATNRRIETVVISIILTFTICWLPYWVAQLMVGFSSGEDPPIPYFYELFLAASCLSYTNSALNPILYAFLSDNFNRQCRNVLGNFRLVKWAQSVGHAQPDGQDRPECRVRGCVRPAASWTAAPHRLVNDNAPINPDHLDSASCCATNSCISRATAGSGEPAKFAIRRPLSRSVKRVNLPGFELDELSPTDHSNPLMAAHRAATSNDQKVDEENKVEVVVVM